MWTASEIAYTAVAGTVLTCLVYAVSAFHTYSMGAVRSVVLLWWRMLGGVVYGWLHIEKYGGSDTYPYFLCSKAITDALSDGYWGCFLRLLLLPNGGYLSYPCYPYAYDTSYWDHTGAFFMVRIHALMRLVSGGHFLVHTLIWGFIVFVASNLLYKVFCERYGAYKYFWLVCLYIYPSLWFWTGGIQKDGLVFAALSVCIYSLHRIQTHSLRRWYGASLLVSLLVLGVVRSYMLMILGPALLVYVYAASRPYGWQQCRRFIAFYGAGVSLIFLANYSIPAIRFFERLAARRIAFMWESGGSEFTSKLWEATPLGFLTYLPTAMVNVLARPFLWDSLNDPLSFCSAVENVLVFLALLYIAVRSRFHFKPDVLTCLLLFFAIGHLLLVGFLVPNTGTMLRYRTVGILFLLLGLASAYANAQSKTTDQFPPTE